MNNMNVSIFSKLSQILIIMITILIIYVSLIIFWTQGIPPLTSILSVDGERCIEEEFQKFMEIKSFRD